MSAPAGPADAGTAVGAADGRTAAGTADASRRDPSPADGIARAVESLYQLEPSGFTDTRSALAAEARRAGDRDLAQQIGKLPRPSRAAFALNLLVHRRPSDVKRLLQLAGSLRDASERLAGSELRELGAARQQLITQLASAAGKLASESGVPLSQASVEEIEESLQAALLDEEAALAVTSGHLARALRMAGTGTPDLSDALPSLPIDRPRRPAQEQRAKKEARKEPARALHHEAERQAMRAQHHGANKQAMRARLKEADETARRAATAAGAARKEVEKARRAHDQAVGRRESAETALVSARREELASSRALTAAEAAARQAETALQRAEQTRRDSSLSPGGKGVPP